MISKVIQYNSTPTVVSDYQAQNAHLQAMINKANGSMGVLKQTSLSTIPTIAQGGYISMGGTLYVVDTSDYTILGSLSAGLNYIALAVSGDNLTATWIQDISAYSWNAVYNYYTNGTNALLPYVIKYDTNYYISIFNQSFNQVLKTDSSPTFSRITQTNKYTSGDYRITEICGELESSITIIEQKLIEYKVEDSGTVKANYSAKLSVANTFPVNYVSLKINGVEEVKDFLVAETYVEISHSISVSKGDLVQIFAFTTTSNSVIVDGFYLSCDEYGINDDYWGVI